MSPEPGISWSASARGRLVQPLQDCRGDVQCRDGIAQQRLLKHQDKALLGGDFGHCFVDLLLQFAQQLLLTFALVLILGDVIKLVWGLENRRINLGVEPMEMFDTLVNPYQFVIIGTGVAVGAGLWYFLHRTRFGKIVRAAVYSRSMVSALGIRIPVIYSMVFALGVGLAALASGVFLPLLPMSLGMDLDIIVQCFAVVVIGGFGSMLGTFVASIIVGVVYSFSILFWPDGALAMIFLILIAVLIWRPWGLFGTELRS